MRIEQISLPTASMDVVIRPNSGLTLREALESVGVNDDNDLDISNYNAQFEPELYESGDVTYFTVCEYDDYGDSCATANFDEMTRTLEAHQIPYDLWGAAFPDATYEEKGVLVAYRPDGNIHYRRENADPVIHKDALLKTLKDLQYSSFGELISGMEALALSAEPPTSIQEASQTYAKSLSKQKDVAAKDQFQQAFREFRKSMEGLGMSPSAINQMAMQTIQKENLKLAEKTDGR